MTGKKGRRSVLDDGDDGEAMGLVCMHIRLLCMQTYTYGQSYLLCRALSIRSSYCSPQN